MRKILSFILRAGAALPADVTQRSAPVPTSTAAVWTVIAQNLLNVGVTVSVEGSLYPAFPASFVLVGPTRLAPGQALIVTRSDAVPWMRAVVVPEGAATDGTCEVAIFGRS